MKQLLSFLCLFFFLTAIYAQTEKFDMVSFTPPTGWERTEANGTVSFMHTSTINDLTSFCQITIYPGSISKAGAYKNFNKAWKKLVTNLTKSKAAPDKHTEITPDGWTLVTGSANVTQQGLTYKTIVASITGFDKTLTIQIKTAGGDYASALHNFFKGLELDKNSTTTINQITTNNSISMNDYEFIPPENWQINKTKDFISLQNPRSGCIIHIFTPQPSSGNLEQDAKNVFDMMYKGWAYQQQGEKSFLLTTGVLPKGLEYFMKEGTMTGYNTNGQYLLEEGTAMVVKTGNTIVIISARHNSGALGHDECYRNYNTWRRFINSFSVKNNSSIKNNGSDDAQRILGLWKVIATGVVSADYVFAANGNYEYGGGLGSSTTTSDMYYEYIYNRAYPFQGSGSYTISGDQLLLKKRSDNSTEQVRFRFEKVNHGGTGWNDRIWLLKKDILGDMEVSYEKVKRIE